MSLRTLVKPITTLSKKYLNETKMIQQNSHSHPLASADLRDLQQQSFADHLVLYLLLLAHVLAVCTLLPPNEIFTSEPLLLADHPVHAHRVAIYRQGLFTSGAPWGYDPAVSAGLVMGPRGDAGAKPQEVLGVLLPFLSAGCVVKLFLFIAALTIPLWMLLVIRRLEFPLGAQVWVLLMLLGPAWLYQSFIGFFHWGLAAFAISSYFAPLGLLLYLEFIYCPSWRRYATALLALALLCLFHILGPVVIAPALVTFTLVAQPLALQWRLVGLLTPIAILLLNAFWIVPMFLITQAPTLPAHAAYAQHFPVDLTYFSITHLLQSMTTPRLLTMLVALGIAVYGFVVMYQRCNARLTTAWVISASFALFLKFFGSFVPILVKMQPARFILSAFVFLTIPVGLALFSMSSKLRLPNAFASAVAALMLTAIASWWEARPIDRSEQTTRINYAEHRLTNTPSFLRLPRRVAVPTTLEPLHPFVKHRTAPTDRLLLQTRVQGEQLILASIWQREVLGNTYLDPTNQARFTANWLWGRELELWTPDALRQALDRWGVTWVLTHTDRAGQLMARATRNAGEKVGTYRAFRFTGESTRFLLGEGKMIASVNRLVLSDLKTHNGLVVLRYRYHPAWESSEHVPIFPYPIPEDPVGFIALQNPPEQVILHFNPIRMFSAIWPQSVGKQSAVDLHH